MHTDRGIFEVLSRAKAQERFAGVDLAVTDAQLPSGVAIRVSTTSLDQAKAVLVKNGVAFVATDDGGVRIPGHYAGNTIIEIYPEL